VTIVVSCADCAFERAFEEFEAASDALEDHSESEVGHEVALQRAVATDGGFEGGEKVRVIEGAASSKDGHYGEVVDVGAGYLLVQFDDGDKIPYDPEEVVLADRERKERNTLNAWSEIGL